MKRRPDVSARICAGFSLAEVTLVIGIAAITILPLMSLLPFGLDTLRESASRSAEARMLQSIASDYQMRAWVPSAVGVSEREIKLEDTEYHFDEAGLPAVEGTFEHTYNARAIVAPDQGPVLNGDGSGGPNRYLRQLTIRITADLKNAEALNEGSPSAWERSLLIANLEQTGTLSALAQP
jgi:uncharacterized protein (TIGR02598 family)